MDASFTVALRMSGGNTRLTGKSRQRMAHEGGDLQKLTQKKPIGKGWVSLAKPKRKPKKGLLLLLLLLLLLKAKSKSLLATSAR
jgi:hypothetical protein